MPAASCRNQDSGSTRLQVGKSIEPRYVITPPAPVGNVRSVGQAADQHSHHPRMQRAWDSAHSLGAAQGWLGVWRGGHRCLHNGQAQHVGSRACHHSEGNCASHSVEVVSLRQAQLEAPQSVLSSLRPPASLGSGSRGHIVTMRVAGLQLDGQAGCLDGGCNRWARTAGGCKGCCRGCPPLEGPPAAMRHLQSGSIMCAAAAAP